MSRIGEMLNRSVNVGYTGVGTMLWKLEIVVKRESVLRMGLTREVGFILGFRRDGRRNGFGTGHRGILRVRRLGLHWSYRLDLIPQRKVPSGSVEPCVSRVVEAEHDGDFIQVLLSQ